MHSHSHQRKGAARKKGAYVFLVQLSPMCGVY